MYITFSSLAMVKRMKANWTMLAMIWVCNQIMLEPFEFPLIRVRWRRLRVVRGSCCVTTIQFCYGRAKSMLVKIIMLLLVMMMMATWQEINQMWAAVNELYGGLSASTAMPGWWMNVENSHKRIPSLSSLHT